jgi:biotin carboxylase
LEDEVIGHASTSLEQRQRPEPSETATVVIRKPCVLLVEVRRPTFIDSALARDDIDVVLLHFDTVQLTDEYLTRTVDVPRFTVAGGVLLEAEAERYLAWIAQIGAVPAYFCNPNETVQVQAQRFARLVGLPHLSEQQVSWVRNKIEMKIRYDALDIPHAKYGRVRTTGDIAGFADSHGWPVVLKPVDSEACIDTYRVAARSELADLPELTLEREWIVEEFISGREYQLCAIVARGQVLDAYLSQNPRPILEVLDGEINANITFAPSEPVPVDAKTLAQRLVDGMRIPYGYLHGELFVTREGEFVMSEIAARLSGCEVPANHGLAYGFDFLSAVLDTYLDRVPRLNYTRDRAVGDLLLPTRQGVVRRVSTDDELMDLPGVISSHVQAHPGDVLDPPRASYACSGYVQVEGATATEVEQRMRHVLDVFVLDVDPVRGD